MRLLALAPIWDANEICSRSRRPSGFGVSPKGLQARHPKRLGRLLRTAQQIYWMGPISAPRGRPDPSASASEMHGQNAALPSSAACLRRPYLMVRPVDDEKSPALSMPGSLRRCRRQDEASTTRLRPRTGHGGRRCCAGTGRAQIARSFILSAFFHGESRRTTVGHGGGTT